MLDAGLGPRARDVEPLDVELAEHRVEPGSAESAVVLLRDLIIAGPGRQLVDDVGVRRADHAVGTPDLEVLVVAHLFGEEVVLDEDDGQAPLPAGVDDASDGGEQSPRIERIGQGGIVLEEPLEEIDDEDRATRRHGERAGAGCGRRPPRARES